MVIFMIQKNWVRYYQIYVLSLEKYKKNYRN